MVEKIIIVGRKSYIGGYLSHYLRDCGSDMISLSSKDCDFLSGDQVRRFFDSLGDANYTVIFLAVINKSHENRFQDYLDNVRMVKNLVDCHRAKNLQSIIYMSSVDVYGRRSLLPITENTKVNPDTWYGLAKQTCEWTLMSSGEVRCPITVLRIPGIYGCWDRDKSVIGKMVASIRKEKRVLIRGDGSVLRDYVYIEDLCRLMTLLLPTKNQGVLNVATGRSRSILEIAECVGRVLEEEFEIVHEAPDEGRQFDLVFDIRCLTSLFPDFRFSDLEVGIRTYV